MIDNLMLFKEQQINHYFTNVVDFNSEISVKKMIEDIGQIIQEKPAIKINYVKDTILNESEDGTTELKEIEKIESVTVTYTVEKDYNGQSLYFPVEKTFIII